MKKISVVASFFNRFLVVFILFLSLPACAPLTSVPPDVPSRIYLPEKKDDLFSRFAPSFVVQNFDKSYNRIGRPSARYIDKDNKKEEIFVNPAEPVIFAQKQSFTTEKVIT